MAGRYQLEELLSEQDGSSVWKATDEALARPVTVRTFTPGFDRVGEVVAAASAAGRLNDHRLVQIFDAQERPEHPYIVTEWPSGARLDDLLAAGPLGPVRAAEIISEAADALAVAHAAGLAHLCLTPDSLWWNTWGGVKISGLGIAAALTGVQAANPVLADTRGLARLLYAALTGYWPGAEQTLLPAAPRSGGRAYRPRQVRAGIPRDIDAITCQALFGEASDGPPILGPAQLAVALAAIARPGSPQPVSPAQRAAPTVMQPVSAAQPACGAQLAAAAPTVMQPVSAAQPVRGPSGSADRDAAGECGAAGRRGAAGGGGADRDAAGECGAAGQRGPSGSADRDAAGECGAAGQRGPSGSGADRDAAGECGAAPAGRSWRRRRRP